MQRLSVLLSALAAFGVVLLLLAAQEVATRVYLGEGQARVGAALRLTMQALDGHLRRFQALPDLLADDARIRRLLLHPDDAGLRLSVNQWLAERNRTLEASDIYVIAADGETIAASNHDRPDSFVGENFSYRPYFSDAMAGGKGRFYALGTTSGVRGYYLSAPVRTPSGTIIGVVAVKIGLDAIESGWRAEGARILVTDPEGIVFLASDPAWLYAGLLPLTPDRLARTALSRRYADARLLPLPHQTARAGGQRLLTLADGDGATREYLVAAAEMPFAGWTVHALLDTATLRGQARLAVAAVLLFLGIAASLAVLLHQRRARLAERIALQEAARAELEARVEERTADLARVNRRIEAEITERRQTEAELRRTQADLVQAGKLAALGQMSAALSHEINQPLAAARNYADSAAILIDRGDTRRARENVGEILSLVDRMAAIARHLREVARKPDTPLQDMAIGPALAEAIKTAQPRLTAAGATVTLDLPADLPMVRGGPVRLQQVLVNLMSNAADAGEEGSDRRIDIRAHAEGDRVRLCIRDHGPGVPEAIADRIFDPFFTTKRVGAGLGLGLSISYNILKDFGGALEVTNDPGGGARFTVTLQAVPGQRAAE